jgi:DNA-binding MarR family transcriptional regulator
MRVMILLPLVRLLHPVKYSGYSSTTKGPLATRLNSATVHISRALRKDGLPSVLAAEHRSAMSVVFFAGPIRMGALATAERVSAPAMTKTVALLERQGLVKRAPDPEDDRAVLIRATAKGARTVRQGRDERVRRIEGALAKLRPEARQRIAAAMGDLERIIDLLELENRPSPAP